MKQNRSSEPAFVPREAHFPLSDKVKDFMCRGLIDEFHLAEIITLCAAHNLSPWLTTSQAWVEKYDPIQHQSHTKSDTAYHFFGYNVWWFTLHPENSRHGPAEPWLQS